MRCDNPDLTPRLVPQATGPGPEAVVLSRRGPLPREASLFAEERKAKTVVLSRDFAGLPPWVGQERIGGDGKQAVEGILDLFKTRGYHSVLVEGGPKVWSLFLNTGVWDRLYLVTAPKILPEGERWDLELAKGWGKSLKFRKFSSLGEDYLAEFGRSE